MSLFEISILGVALAMDAIAVSMANCMVYANLKFKDYALMPLFFGGFQGAMPLLGFFAGGFFAEIITKYSGIVIFVILAVVGGKMILESLVNHEDESSNDKKYSVWLIFIQAVATSIDAFAVGVGFAAVEADIISSVIIIALITAVLVTAAILVGRKFGDVFGNKAGIAGGIVLIIIGIKALI